eukprot:6198571-Pleurochrysis_carterae.AAC.1
MMQHNGTKNGKQNDDNSQKHVNLVHSDVDCVRTLLCSLSFSQHVVTTTRYLNKAVQTAAR